MQNQIILDERQKQIFELLNHAKDLINDTKLLTKIKNFFSGKSTYSGIYFHGSVGRGKTMLMQKFYEQLRVPKEIIHYQKFMQSLHKKLHTLQNRSTSKIVQELSNEIARRSQVVCMDEFEIKDITDAMIIMHLFMHLIDRGIFIFITTNTMPDNLYKDGIQRESFLPFIEIIKKTFLILSLDDDSVDYRYKNVATEKRILFSVGGSNNLDENKQLIEKIKLRLCGEEQPTRGSVTTFGRELIFSKVRKNILFTDFAELFERDIGYADYVNICEVFKIVIVEKVRKIAADETNIAIRFINFVDNIYFNKVLLFMEIECDLKEIYLAGSKLGEFKRTLSRLNEINSKQYLEKAV